MRVLIDSLDFEAAATGTGGSGTVLELGTLPLLLGGFAANILIGLTSGKKLRTDS
jgi:hypothetical protein